jgi:hypothetical protein
MPTFPDEAYAAGVAEAGLFRVTWGVTRPLTSAAAESSVRTANILWVRPRIQPTAMGLTKPPSFALPAADLGVTTGSFGDANNTWALPSRFWDADVSG